MEIEFDSVTDYLLLLRGVASVVNGPATMILLAAAVSDFYLPYADMAEHKIQSGSGAAGAEEGLTLRLKPVPKALSALRHIWAPNAFIVSFKLETDPHLLLSKAAGAITKYGVHAVVANQLEQRYRQLHIVSPAAIADLGLDLAADGTPNADVSK
jgi:phosphopantothenate-cysteine ligase